MNSNEEIDILPRFDACHEETRRNVLRGLLGAKGAGLMMGNIRLVPKITKMATRNAA